MRGSMLPQRSRIQHPRNFRRNPQRPKTSLVAIVLAAGASRRFGDDNKLVSDWNGVPMVRHVVLQVLSVGVDSVIVVTGYDRETIESALHDLPVTFVFNADWKSGMGCSLASGVRSAHDATGFLIVLGDMPRVSSASLIALVSEAGAHPDSIVLPGRIGPPLILPRALRPELESLSGESGMRNIIATINHPLRNVNLPEFELEDVDKRV